MLKPIPKRTGSHLRCVRRDRTTNWRLSWRKKIDKPISLNLGVPGVNTLLTDTLSDLVLLDREFVVKNAKDFSYRDKAAGIYMKRAFSIERARDVYESAPYNKDNLHWVKKT